MVNEPYEDELGCEIDVFVRDGDVFQVQFQGRQVRARVIDYDIEFPCSAHNVKMDDEQQYYMEIIV